MHWRTSLGHNRRDLDFQNEQVHRDLRDDNEDHPDRDQQVIILALINFPRDEIFGIVRDYARQVYHRLDQVQGEWYDIARELPWAFPWAFVCATMVCILA